MLLVCRSCGARRPPEPAARALLAEDPGAHLRCPACGRLTARAVVGTAREAAPPRPAGTCPADPAPEPLAPPVADLGGSADIDEDDGWGGREVLLRRGGRVIPFAGLDPLRRLAIQGKVRASDVLSRDGVRWEPLDRVPELQPYLAVSRRLAEPSEAGGGGALAEASDAASGWADADEPTTECIPRRDPEAPRVPARPAKHTDGA